MDPDSWIEIGSVFEEISLGPQEDLESEPLITSTDRQFSFSLEGIDFDRELLHLYYGELPPPPVERSLLIKFTPEPWPEPRHPIKGQPYVGKRYRQECRRWQRRHKAWRRGPKVQHTGIFIPRAAIDVVGPGEYSITPR